MNNIISLVIMAVVVMMVFKRLFVKKKKFGKIKATVKFLCYAMILCPLTLLAVVKFPQQSLVYGGKMALVAHRVKSDVTGVVRRLDYQAGRYVPQPVKRLQKPVERAYTRYGVRDTQRYASDVIGLGGFKVSKPKPSMFEKVSNGLFNVGKWVGGLFV